MPAPPPPQFTKMHDIERIAAGAVVDVIGVVYQVGGRGAFGGGAGRGRGWWRSARAEARPGGARGRLVRAAARSCEPAAVSAHLVAPAPPAPLARPPKVNAPQRITRRDGTDTDKRSVHIRDDSGASIEVRAAARGAGLLARGRGLWP
jgi:hypothetical protein